MKKDTRQSYKYISYRKDRDSWQVTFPVTVPDPTSKKGVKKQNIIKQCKTLEEALDERERMMTLFHLDSSLLIKLEKEAEPQEPLEEQEFSKLLLEWFDTIKSKELSVSTRRLYRRQVNLIALALKGKKIKDVTRHMLDAIVMAQEKHSKSNGVKTQNAINTFLRTINKTELKSRVRIIESRKPREALTEQEAKDVLSYISKRRPLYSFLYYMFFVTGCRRSELLGLTWRYVDFTRSEIHIVNVLLRNERYQYELVNRTKTPAGKRVICLPPQAIKRLKFWKIIREAQGQADPDDFVFLNSRGNHMNPAQVTEYFHDAVKAVGIQKNVTLHSTRHTFATILANEGVPLYIIQKMGGWKNLQTLEHIYLHENTERTREYLEKAGFYHVFVCQKRP